MMTTVVSAAVAGVAIGMAVAQNTSLEVGPGRAVSALAVLVAVLVYTVLSSAPKGGSGRFASFASGQTAPAPGDSEDEHVIFKHARLGIPEIERRADDFYNLMKMRRTIRFFSTDPVPLSVIKRCVLTGGTAPSGAHCQPWHFAIVSSPGAKQKVRAAVEKEELVNYQNRMGQPWVDEVADLVSGLPDAHLKPYLTEAPHLIVVFKKRHDIGPDGEKIIVRYPEESVGIASGLLIAAIQTANLVTLTSTPLGAEKEIRKILGMPDHFKVYLLMPVGFPDVTATVPFRRDERKHLADIMSVH